MILSNILLYHTFLPELELGLTAGVTGRQEMLTPLGIWPDPTSGISRGQCLFCSRICIPYRVYGIDYCSLFVLFIYTLNNA
jgi:hypothetical protein